MRDAYQTLGVSRDASPEDIKRAYRKLAAQHHPDKGGDTAKFQEIQQAYETLTDPQKRHQHDNPFQGNPHGSHFEFHFGGGGPEDIFKRFFQQGFSYNPFGHQQRRNKDLKIVIKVTLESTLKDQQKTVNVQTTKGDIFNIDVNIPRGVTPGTTIKYSQMGDNLFETLARGDLFVVVDVEIPYNFELNGNNLFTQITIDAIDAMLGVDKEVTGVDGKTFLVKIPRGCKYGTKFSLNQQGIYYMNSNLRGDLIVSVIIDIPMLDETQLNLIRSIRSTK